MNQRQSGNCDRVETRRTIRHVPSRGTSLFIAYRGAESRRLKLQFQSEAELSLIDAVATQICDAGNTGEIIQVIDCPVRIQDHARDVRAGVRKVRCVAEVERLHSE